ncbi:MAG: HEPN domain-containing protein [Ignavibacteriales bacterium]|nr:HEPN domain-containing protein [Ignavibacteriales bacterium]
MAPNNEAIHTKVKQWFEIAEEDFHLAEQSFRISSPVPYRLIAYHCQQSAEKYLKGLLVFLQIDFPYTHSIERLLVLIPSNLVLPASFSEAQDLSDYAIAKRYPDYYEKVTKEDAERTFVLALMVKNFVLSNVHLN